MKNLSVVEKSELLIVLRVQIKTYETELCALYDPSQEWFSDNESSLIRRKRRLEFFLKQVEKVEDDQVIAVDTKLVDEFKLKVTDQLPYLTE